MDKKAKSYLLDSVIRGKPAPKILIREHLSSSTRKTIREVVDGQQRLRAIFEYMDDAFRVSRTHNEEYAGCYFSELPDEVQTSIRAYQIATDCLINISDSEVRDIFARLNTYGVKLNKIELLHAECFGAFRTAAFALGNEFETFWLSNEILTEASVSRMADAELSAELLVAMADGIQDKGRLRWYFRTWDDEFPSRPVYEKQFRSTMDTIGTLFPDGLASNEFSRPVLFYSLFCAIAHMQFGLPRLRTKRVRINPQRMARVMNQLAEVDQIRKTDGRNAHEEEFLIAAKRATTHQPERELRAKFLCELIRKGLG
ncbi:MAG: DUF262 domain-containing protein [Planctomycetota bacterium]